MAVKGQKPAASEVVSNTEKTVKNLLTTSVAYVQQVIQAQDNFNKVKEDMDATVETLRTVIPNLEKEIAVKMETFDKQISTKKEELIALDGEFAEKKRTMDVSLDDHKKQLSREISQATADYQTELNTATTQLLENKMKQKGYAVLTTKEYEGFKSEIESLKGDKSDEITKAKKEAKAEVEAQFSAKINELTTKDLLNTQENKNLREQLAELKMRDAANTKALADSVIANATKANASVTVDGNGRK